MLDSCPDVQAFATLCRFRCGRSPVGRWRSAGAAAAAAAAAGAAAAGPPATVCGQHVSPPRAAAAGRLRPGRLLIAPCFEAQGETVGHRAADLPLLHPAEVQPAVAGHLGAVRRREPRRRSTTTSTASGTPTSSTTSRSTSATTRSRTASIGKIVIYNMEERQRVKIVDYVGSKKVETSKIDEKLKEANAADPPRHVHRSRPGAQGRGHRPRHAEGEGLPVRRGHARDQGRCPAARSWCTSPSTWTKGRRSRSGTIDFVGNKAISDGTLKQQMKENKAALVCCSFITGRGTYQETKFDEDAEKVVEYYRDQRLHARRNVGVPEAQGRRATRRTRRRAGSSCRIPVTEGPRYKVGNFDVAGNTVVKTECLQPLFKLEPGEYYSEKRIRKGLEKAREVYGAGGYWSSPASPDYKFRDDPNPNEPEAPDALKAPEAPKPKDAAPIVDVTMRMQEGQAVLRQPHHLHRQHDDARQRHPPRDAAGRGRRLQHRGAEVQHQAAESARLLQAARGQAKDVDVEKTPNETNKVDVKLKLEEQNRNQLTFGAGVSQFEGFFGQLSFQTVELPRPRREPDACRCRPARARRTTRWRSPSRSCSTATSPAASTSSTQRRPLHRPVHAAVDRRRRRRSGFPLGAASRGCSRTTATSGCGSPRSATSISDPIVLARNPFLRDSLLHRRRRRAHHQQGRRRASSTTRSTSRSSRPPASASPRRSTSPASAATPTSTSRCSKASGSSSRTPRLSLGFRAQAEYIHPFSGSTGAADLREAVPRRRVQRPRLRHPHDRPAGSGHRPRARRQQEPAVQRRRADHDRRAGPPDSVLRRRAGAGRARCCRAAGAYVPDRRVARRSTVVPGPELQPDGTSRPRPAPKSGSSCRC